MNSGNGSMLANGIRIWIIMTWDVITPCHTLTSNVELSQQVMALHINAWYMHVCLSFIRVKPSLQSANTIMIQVFLISL